MVKKKVYTSDFMQYFDYRSKPLTLPAYGGMDEEQSIVDCEAVPAVCFVLGLGNLAPLRGAVAVNNGQ